MLLLVLPFYFILTLFIEKVTMLFNFYLYF